MASFGASEPIVVCGVGGINDGLYLASGGGGYTITLGQTIASASWFPTPLMPDCGTGCVAKLRWPYLTTGICGRIDIANVDRPNTASIWTCSLSDAAYWYQNDRVEIAKIALDRIIREGLKKSPESGE